ncbi:MAG: Spx/MgsR family RNA polymerase-binding regulatory protein [Bacteroidota bacterium]
MIVYGIKNCDTMQKAFKWLDANHITYTFHDYKKESITKEKIEEWLKHFPITELINTKGITYKKLSDEEKLSITNKNKAIELMIQKTSMIKRPLVEMKDDLMLGFKVDEWEKKLL